MSSEGTVQRRVWLSLGAVCRLFRVNGGKGWLSGAGPVKRLHDGSVLVPAGRPVALGFGQPNGDPLVGASDLCGWTKVIVTPEMVGHSIAVFTAIETKRSRGGKVSDDQINFVDQVQRSGGIAGIANSPEAARAIIDDWLAKNGGKLG